jgi:hypothetical protein
MKEDTPQSSDAGHGPSRGYSKMNAHLKNYLDRHPAHKGEQQSRSRSLGRPAFGKKGKKKTKKA